VSTVEASDGVRLYVEAHGDGIPVVFSCAFATTHENFRPQVEPLVAGGARVILWDYRSHGRSEAGDPESYGIEQVIDDLGRVLDHAAPGQPAVVGGLSLGGLVSLHFALRHPERVRGLLLLDSGPGFKNPEAAARWQAQVEKTGSILRERGMTVLTRGKAAATAIGRDPELPAAQAAARAIEAQDPVAVAEFGRRVAGPAPCVIDDLRRIEAPALVLVGEHDAAYLRAADVMEAKLPKASKLVLRDAGHISNIEAADALNSAVLRFLADLPEPAGQSR
jgi:pimeloyl-ACP methyl ester carboxylesterase